VKKAIEANPNDPSVKARLLSCARNIATYTTEMVSVGDEEGLRKVMEAARTCATHARTLMAATQRGYEDFFESCKNFAGSALDLAKLLQELARRITDNAHQQKVINSYNSIKEIGPQMIRVAKKAYENPNSVESQQELVQMSRQLAGKIAYAISVSQPDGGKVQNELSTSQPTIPLPKVDSISEPQPTSAETGRGAPGRRRTVREPQMGKEILRRARTATVTRQIAETIEGGVNADAESKEPEVSSAPSPMPPPPKQEPVKQPEKPLVPSKMDEEDGPDSVIASLEARMNKEEEITKQSEASKGSGSEWKAKYEAAAQEIEKLKQENELLKEENENLTKVVETMKKRAALKS